jgi:alpha-D-ribose 1-methylphosphonate 5-triphosphate synthase subunit PhnG
MTELVREEWISTLSLVPDSALREVIDRLPADWVIKPRALPQEGLGLLKLQDSALGEPFYLGEFPLSSCWLSITTQEGLTAEGAALIMDNCIDRAEQLALCDAVLAAKLPGWERVAELLAQGLERKRAIANERKAILAHTRVDFSLLDEAGGDHA